jgi:Fibronectin type III domain
MDILQRAPEFIGQSALDNSEIQTIDIVDIIINNIDYVRPRDAKRYTFIELVVSGDYINVLGNTGEFEKSPGGNFLANGNDFILFNKITKQQYLTLIVNSTYNSSNNTTNIIVKTLDDSISTIEKYNNSWNNWIIILSCGLDWSQSIIECPNATDLKSTFITRNSVQLQWKSGFGAEVNYIRIKPRNQDSWVNYTSPGSNTFIRIFGLIPNTRYDWQICTSCGLNKSNFYSAIQTFETQP